MGVIGVIAEYNPFHSGHRYHIQEIRRTFGSGCGIICVMSGNWVQRGDAALCDKWTRARFALEGGADLILELPTVWAASSAESFARGSVSILDATGLVDTLSFGSETGDLAPLEAAAGFLLSPEYDENLRTFLDEGFSFPHARQKAAELILGPEADCLKQANNNLGIEYLRAIRHLGSSITPSTLLRKGASHDSAEASSDFASASYLRRRLLQGSGEGLHSYLSEEAMAAMQPEHLYALSYGARGVFARLRAMEADEFLFLPDCSEGLHNKLYEASRNTNTLEALYEAVKSRRYTHARIRRLVLWAFLGLKEADRPTFPPYLRVLGMNARGQALLKEMKRTNQVPILTKAAHVQKLDEESRTLFQLEDRCTKLYHLCARNFETAVLPDEYTANPIQLT